MEENELIQADKYWTNEALLALESNPSLALEAVKFHLWFQRMTIMANEGALILLKKVDGGYNVEAVSCSDLDTLKFMFAESKNNIISG